MHSSKLACSVAYWSKHPLPMFGFFAVVSFIISGFLFVSVCWTKIYQHFKSVSDSMKGAKRKHLASGERKVFIKAVALSASYGICWAGMVVDIIIEQSSGIPISMAADIFRVYMFLAYTFVCPVVLILNDNRVGSAVIPFLHQNIVQQVPESIAVVVVPEQGDHRVNNLSKNLETPTKKITI